MKKKINLIIATGGTGGHIFPALALVEMLNKDGHSHLILADRRFLNFKSQFQKSLNYNIIQSSSLAGNLILKAFGLIQILLGTIQAMFAIIKTRPNLMVSFGGYPAFPSMIAAAVFRVPILIHEPNMLIGRASKVFLGISKAVSLAFKGTKRIESVDKKKLFYTGTPIRSKILDARKSKYPSLTGSNKIHILVLGGSQGARIFSEVIPASILLLDHRLRKRLYIHQQCRAENLDELKIFYKEHGIEAEIKTFFDNIGQEFKKSHLVISRSGALTVSELIAVGRPAILIPYAFAMDNHQFFNAKLLEENKAAKIILEKDFTPKQLALTLQGLAGKVQMLSTYANHSKSLFKDWNNSFYNLVKTCVQERY